MNRAIEKLCSSELLYGMLALILPLSYTVLWLLNNTQLPGNDAANYLMTSVNIFQRFHEHGLWNGIEGIYFERGWRPIFFPVLAVPFMLISNGNLYFSYSAVAILCIIASATYVYLFFRLKLDRFSAAIATNLVGLLPYIQAQGVMFYAEAALFPCVIGCVYHLIKSDYLRDRKQTLCFLALFVLAFVLRPVEAVTHLFLILSLFLALGWYHHYFSVRQILIVLAISLSALCCMLLFAVLPYIHFTPAHVIDGGILDKKMATVIRCSLIGAGISTLFIWIILLASNFKQLGYDLWVSFNNKNSKKSLLVPTFFIAFALVLLWFLPFAFETFQWVYRTSLGDVASSTGSLSGSHFSFKVLEIYLREEGILPVIGIILLAMVAFPCLSSSNRRSVITSKPFIFLLLLAPFSLWESFYTVQIVTRKLSIAVPAVLMTMMLIALQRGRYWSLRVIAMILMIVVLFSLSVFLVVTPLQQSPIPFINNMVGYFVPQPAKLQPDPHKVVIDFLTRQATKYHLTSIGLELDPGTPDARHPLEAEPVDPFLVSTMVVAAKQHYAVSYPYFSTYTSSNMRNLKERFDAIFLSAPAAEMLVSKTAAQYYSKQYAVESNASLKTLYELLMYYSKNKLNKVGWAVGSCIKINTEKRGEYLGCLLLPR